MPEAVLMSLFTGNPNFLSSSKISPKFSGSEIPRFTPTP